MHFLLENISVEMKLVFVLLGISLVISLVLGYEEMYQGFNACGEGGWSCIFIKGKYEITYTCPKQQPNARVWVWTARFPVGANSFIVRDCNHLEVHFDCTTGLRTTVLRQFKIINVTNLEILPPLQPGIFLHDNDQVPQAPPVLYISNVKKIKLYPGMFDKPGGSCRYKFLEMASLTLENVHIDRIMKNLFHNQLLNTFVMKNVTIGGIDSNGMNIAADTTVTGTSFPLIVGNSVSLRGETIIFENNRFKNIQSNGMTIKSKEFKFSNNYVQEISTQGLDVLGAKIEITKNVFHHLETGAFQKVTPGYSPLTYEIASKFTYNFSENSIESIDPGSIHLNWEMYKKVCSEIIFQHNAFNCSCSNLGWMSINNGLGPKISKVKEFYNVYFNKGDNVCYGHHHCPLNVVIAQIQDVCSDKTNISAICSTTSEVTEAVTSTLSDEATLPQINLTENTSEENSPFTNRVEVTEKIIPVLSYTENQTSKLGTTGLPVWLIVIPVIVLLATVSIGIFIWWYKKKEKRQTIMTMYKNEKGADTDNLIVINEHHNQLYDKQ